MTDCAAKGIVRVLLGVVLVAGLLQAPTGAQDRLKGMPGYQQYQKMVASSAGGVLQSGAINADWSADGGSFEYTLDGKRFKYDVAAKNATEIGPAPDAGAGRGGRGGRGGAPGVERGRQAVSADSPDGKLKALYKDRNLWIADASGANPVAITTDGSEQARIKYGTASWVYGEELGQRTAMWWSPDSTKVAYYRFDEKQVPDYVLQLDQTQVQSKADVEAYPKAGAPNPIVELFVYDVATKKSTKVDVRDGKPFDNSVVGHYVYRVAWSPDGTELLFNRTNRRQNILEFIAANPATGATRVIVHEEWPTGWVTNSPAMQFLKDNNRFIWESERNGWANLYLYDLSGKLIAPLTNHTTFEVGAIVKVDETAGVVFYTARSGDNHMKMQLHRVGLDGKGDVRLTDPAFNHTIGACTGATPFGGGGRGGQGGGSCGISPDNRYFVDIYQTHNMPPATRLIDGNGKVVAELAKSDMAKFEQLGLKKAEMFTYKAADGKTTAAWTDSVSIELRSVEEISGADAGLWRPRLGREYRARNVHHAISAHRVRLPRRQSRLAFRAGDGQAPARQHLHEARTGRDGRHGGGHQGAREPALRRQDARRHLRHVVRRVLVGDVAAAASRRLRRRLRFVAGDRVVPLRQHLHRAVHVDPAGEQGRLRSGQRDEPARRT